MALRNPSCEAEKKYNICAKTTVSKKLFTSHHAIHKYHTHKSTTTVHVYARFIRAFARQCFRADECGKHWASHIIWVLCVVYMSILLAPFSFSRMLFIAFYCYMSTVLRLLFVRRAHTFANAYKNLRMYAELWWWLKVHTIQKETEHNNEIWCANTLIIHAYTSQCVCVCCIVASLHLSM